MVLTLPVADCCFIPPSHDLCLFNKSLLPHGVSLVLCKDDIPWLDCHGYLPLRLWGPFLESPDNLRALKVVAVYFEDRSFDSFADNMLKISVKKNKMD